MSEAGAHHSFNILLIEDDDVDSEAILRCLHGHEAWRVLAVKSAQEAFRILRDREEQTPAAGPSLILLDLDLPGMDGFEFLSVLRDDPLLKNSIVLVLSGLATQHNRARAFAYGVAEYLLKDNLDSTCTELLRLLEPYQRL